MNSERESAIPTPPVLEVGAECEVASGYTNVDSPGILATLTKRSDQPPELGPYLESKCSPAPSDVSLYTDGRCTPTEKRQSSLVPDTDNDLSHGLGEYADTPCDGGVIVDGLVTLSPIGDEVAQDSTGESYYSDSMLDSTRESEGEELSLSIPPLLTPLGDPSSETHCGQDNPSDSGCDNDASVQDIEEKEGSITSDIPCNINMEAQASDPTAGMGLDSRAGCISSPDISSDVLDTIMHNHTESLSSDSHPANVSSACSLSDSDSNIEAQDTASDTGKCEFDRVSSVDTASIGCNEINTTRELPENKSTCDVDKPFSASTANDSREASNSNESIGSESNCTVDPGTQELNNEPQIVENAETDSHIRSTESKVSDSPVSKVLSSTTCMVGELTRCSAEETQHGNDAEAIHQVNKPSRVPDGLAAHDQSEPSKMPDKLAPHDQSESSGVPEKLASHDQRETCAVPDSLASHDQSESSGVPGGLIPCELSETPRVPNSLVPHDQRELSRVPDGLAPREQSKPVLQYTEILAAHGEVCPTKCTDPPQQPVVNIPLATEQNSPVAQQTKSTNPQHVWQPPLENSERVPKSSHKENSASSRPTENNSKLKGNLADINRNYDYLNSKFYKKHITHNERIVCKAKHYRKNSFHDVVKGQSEALDAATKTSVESEEKPPRSKDNVHVPKLHSHNKPSAQQHMSHRYNHKDNGSSPQISKTHTHSSSHDNPKSKQHEGGERTSSHKAHTDSSIRHSGSPCAKWIIGDTGDYSVSDKHHDNRRMEDPEPLKLKLKLQPNNNTSQRKEYFVQRQCAKNVKYDIPSLSQKTLKEEIARRHVSRHWLYTSPNSSQSVPYCDSEKQHHARKAQNQRLVRFALHHGRCVLVSSSLSAYKQRSRLPQLKTQLPQNVSKREFLQQIFHSKPTVVVKRLKRNRARRGSDKHVDTHQNRDHTKMSLNGLLNGITNGLDYKQTGSHIVDSRPNIEVTCDPVISPLRQDTAKLNHHPMGDLPSHHPHKHSHAHNPSKTPRTQKHSNVICIPHERQRGHKVNAIPNVPLHHHGPGLNTTPVRHIPAVPQVGCSPTPIFQPGTHIVGTQEHRNDSHVISNKHGQCGPSDALSGASLPSENTPRSPSSLMHYRPFPVKQKDSARASLHPPAVTEGSPDRRKAESLPQTPAKIAPDLSPPVLTKIKDTPPQPQSLGSSSISPKMPILDKIYSVPKSNPVLDTVHKLSPVVVLHKIDPRTKKPTVKNAIKRQLLFDTFAQELSSGKAIDAYSQDSPVAKRKRSLPPDISINKFVATNSSVVSSELRAKANGERAVSPETTHSFALDVDKPGFAAGDNCESVAQSGGSSLYQYKPISGYVPSYIRQSLTDEIPEVREVLDGIIDQVEGENSPQDMNLVIQDVVSLQGLGAAQLWGDECATNTKQPQEPECDYTRSRAESQPCESLVQKHPTGTVKCKISDGAHNKKAAREKQSCEPTDSVKKKTRLEYMCDKTVKTLKLRLKPLQLPPPSSIKSSIITKPCAVVLDKNLNHTELVNGISVTKNYEQYSQKVKNHSQGQTVKSQFNSLSKLKPASLRGDKRRRKADRRPSVKPGSLLYKRKTSRKRKRKRNRTPVHVIKCISEDENDLPDIEPLRKKPRPTPLFNLRTLGGFANQCVIENNQPIPIIPLESRHYKSADPSLDTPKQASIQEVGPKQGQKNDSVVRVGPSNTCADEQASCGGRHNAKIQDPSRPTGPTQDNSQRSTDVGHPGATVPASEMPSLLRVEPGNPDVLALSLGSGYSEWPKDMCATADMIVDYASRKSKELITSACTTLSFSATSTEGPTPAFTPISDSSQLIPFVSSPPCVHTQPKETPMLENTMKDKSVDSHTDESLVSEFSGDYQSTVAYGINTDVESPMSESRDVRPPEARGLDEKLATQHESDAKEDKPVPHDGKDVNYAQKDTGDPWPAFSHSTDINGSSSPLSVRSHSGSTGSNRHISPPQLPKNILTENTHIEGPTGLATLANVASLVIRRSNESVDHAVTVGPHDEMAASTPDKCDNDKDCAIERSHKGTRPSATCKMNKSGNSKDSSVECGKSDVLHSSSSTENESWTVRKGTKGGFSVVLRKLSDTNLDSADIKKSTGSKPNSPENNHIGTSDRTGAREKNPGVGSSALSQSRSMVEQLLSSEYGSDDEVHTDSFHDTNLKISSRVRGDETIVSLKMRTGSSDEERAKSGQTVVDSDRMSTDCDANILTPLPSIKSPEGRPSTNESRVNCASAVAQSGTTPSSSGFTDTCTRDSPDACDVFSIASDLSGEHDADATKLPDCNEGLSDPEETLDDSDVIADDDSVHESTLDDGTTDSPSSKKAKLPDDLIAGSTPTESATGPRKSEEAYDGAAQSTPDDTSIRSGWDGKAKPSKDLVSITSKLLNQSLRGEDSSIAEHISSKRENSALSATHEKSPSEKCPFTPEPYSPGPSSVLPFSPVPCDDNNHPELSLTHQPHDCITSDAHTTQRASVVEREASNEPDNQTSLVKPVELESTPAISEDSCHNVGASKQNLAGPGDLTGHQAEGNGIDILGDKLTHRTSSTKQVIQGTDIEPICSSARLPSADTTGSRPAVVDAKCKQISSVQDNMDTFDESEKVTEKPKGAGESEESGSPPHPVKPKQGLTSPPARSLPGNLISEPSAAFTKNAKNRGNDKDECEEVSEADLLDNAIKSINPEPPVTTVAEDKDAVNEEPSLIPESLHTPVHVMPPQSNDAMAGEVALAVRQITAECHLMEMEPTAGLYKAAEPLPEAAVHKPGSLTPSSQWKTTIGSPVYEQEVGFYPKYMKTILDSNNMSREMCIEMDSAELETVYAEERAKLEKLQDWLEKLDCQKNMLLTKGKKITDSMKYIDLCRLRHRGKSDVSQPKGEQGILSPGASCVSKSSDTDKGEFLFNLPSLIPATQGSASTSDKDKKACKDSEGPLDGSVSKLAPGIVPPGAGVDGTMPHVVSITPVVPDPAPVEPKKEKSKRGRRKKKKTTEEEKTSCSKGVSKMTTRNSTKSSSLESTNKQSKDERVYFQMPSLPVIEDTTFYPNIMKDVDEGVPGKAQLNARSQLRAEEQDIERMIDKQLSIDDNTIAEEDTLAKAMMLSDVYDDDDMQKDCEPNAMVTPTTEQYGGAFRDKRQITDVNNRGVIFPQSQGGINTQSVPLGYTPAAACVTTIADRAGPKPFSGAPSFSHTGPQPPMRMMNNSDSDASNLIGRRQNTTPQENSKSANYYENSKVPLHHDRFQDLKIKRRYTRTKIIEKVDTSPALQYTKQKEIINGMSGYNMNTMNESSRRPPEYKMKDMQSSEYTKHKPSMGFVPPSPPKCHPGAQYSPAQVTKSTPSFVPPSPPTSYSSSQYSPGHIQTQYSPGQMPKSSASFVTPSPPSNLSSSQYSPANTAKSTSPYVPPSPPTNVSGAQYSPVHIIKSAASFVPPSPPKNPTQYNSVPAGQKANQFLPTSPPTNVSHYAPVHKQHMASMSQAQISDDPRTHLNDMPRQPGSAAHSSYNPGSTKSHLPMNAPQHTFGGPRPQAPEPIRPYIQEEPRHGLPAAPRLPHHETYNSRIKEPLRTNIPEAHKPSVPESRVHRQAPPRSSMSQPHRPHIAEPPRLHAPELMKALHPEPPRAHMSEPNRITGSMSGPSKSFMSDVDSRNPPGYLRGHMIDTPRSQALDPPKSHQFENTRSHPQDSHKSIVTDKSRAETDSLPDKPRKFDYPYPTVRDVMPHPDSYPVYNPQEGPMIRTPYPFDCFSGPVLSHQQMQHHARLYGLGMPPSGSLESPVSSSPLVSPRAAARTSPMNSNSGSQKSGAYKPAPKDNPPTSSAHRPGFNPQSSDAYAANRMNPNSPEYGFGGPMGPFSLPPAHVYPGLTTGGLPSHMMGPGHPEPPLRHVMGTEQNSMAAGMSFQHNPYAQQQQQYGKSAVSVAHPESDSSSCSVPTPSAEGPPSPPRACVNCAKPVAYLCARCRQQAYCSETCQTLAWPAHSYSCYPGK